MFPLQKRIKPMKRAACIVTKWSQMAQVFASSPFRFCFRIMLPRCPAANSVVRPAAMLYANSAVGLKSLLSMDVAVRM